MKTQSCGINLEEKINKRLGVIEECFTILENAMKYNEYNVHFLRQKDKLNIERRVLKNLLK